MKQRITIEDLAKLTQDQRESLNNLWLPEMYDAAVGYVCRDAEENVYDAIEYIVGEILVQESYGRKFVNITLRSLKSMGAPDELADEQYEEIEDEECEEDIEFECFDPDYFNKSECLPLLSIGQMIKILRDNDYGHGSFYLDIKERKEKSGVGRDITQYLSYGRDFEEMELCDALWEAVKAIL